jgi:tRNA-splicing ligase RtcB (3'-phosphate/5'-hydroxy nucleic acid ligase)
MLVYKGKYSTARVMIDGIEESCASQIIQFVNHPAFINDSIIMPDTHYGAGCVIGFTMVIPNPLMIVPNVVGVDIYCGMLSINLGPDLFSKISKEELEAFIKKSIPMGTNVHHKPVVNFEKEIDWSNLTRISSEQVENNRVYSYNDFIQKAKERELNSQRTELSLGTLGGGNHFIEVGKSQNTGDYWITIHSGSRNYGKRVCDYWQRRAKSLMSQFDETQYVKELEELKATISDKRDLPKRIKELKNKFKIGVHRSKGLEYLEGKEADDYLNDMILAQEMGRNNRRIISDLILKGLGLEIKDFIETAHNFIDFEDRTIRKGAIRSYKGERVIIPFNMKDGLLICEGKSNPDWNFSAPHGAGRRMSRTDAKNELTLEKYKKDMEEAGVYSTSICRATLDEAPDAYKDSEIIEKAIEPTVKILDKVKPIISIKDDTEDKRRKKKKG